MKMMMKDVKIVDTMFNKIQVREIEKGGNKVKNTYREKN